MAPSLQNLRRFRAKNCDKLLLHKLTPLMRCWSSAKAETNNILMVQHPAYSADVLKLPLMGICPSSFCVQFGIIVVKIDALFIYTSIYIFHYISA